MTPFGSSLAGGMACAATGTAHGLAGRMTRSERAVARILGVDSPQRVSRDELNGDRACLDAAFVPEVVHVIPTGIDESHPDRVHLRPAVAIVTVIGGHGPGGDDDQ